MSKPLFDNVGLDIKEYANGMYLSSILGYILVALGICVASFALLGGLGFIGLFIGIGVIAVGHLKSKLAVMKLYAYGELVERVMEIESNVCNVKGGGGKGKKEPAPKKIVVEPVSYDLPITEKNPDGTWDCMFCDYRNPSGVNICKKCSALARFK